MFKRIKLPEYFKKNIPSDCIICASRPSLYLNQINVFQAKFYCPHSNPPARPHFQPSTLFKIITILSNIMLVYGVINDVNQMQKNFTIKQVLIFLEITFNICTIGFNLMCLTKNKIKLREAHATISILNNKFLFGVGAILTGNSAKKLHNILQRFIMLILLEELISFCVVLVVDNVDNKLFIRMWMLEICIFCNVSLGLSCMHHLFLYESMFGACFEEIEKFLDHLYTFSRRTVTTTHVLRGNIFIDRLRKLQRLYMGLRQSFLLNENFLQPEFLMTYSTYVCLLLIGYGYFAFMFFQGEVIPLKFDFHVICKSLAIVAAFSALCYHCEKVANMVCHKICFKLIEICFFFRMKKYYHSYLSFLLPS
jgi:hypothetical protein